MKQHRQLVQLDSTKNLFFPERFESKSESCEMKLFTTIESKMLWY